MRQIVRLKLGKVATRLRHNHGVALDYDDAEIGQIASRCTEVDSGARNVAQIITGTLLPEIIARAARPHGGGCGAVVVASVARRQWGVHVRVRVNRERGVIAEA